MQVFFFFGQYHFANTQRANRAISGGLVDGDMSEHSRMVPPTQIHTPEDAELPLSSEQGCTHVAAAQPSCLSTGSGGTLSLSADTLPSVRFVLCVWLWFNRWEELVLSLLLSLS